MKMAKPSAKRLERSRSLISHDRDIPGFGVSLAGMDEAGRGALIGCVVAGCVIMPENPVFEWIDDSKKLSRQKREALYELIAEHAIYMGVGTAGASEIESMNILGATRLAMERAAHKAPASLCLVDAVDRLFLPFPTRAVMHGDAVSYSIAAASIVAKVSRDRMMAELARLYPEYGIERHMGYGTREHIEALRKYGACPEHRAAFVSKFVEGA